jgi:hypothetical protein
LNLPRNGGVGIEHRFASSLEPGDVAELLAGPAAQSLGHYRLAM